MEPVLLLGKHRFEAVDIRIRVKGGGNVSQIYGELHQASLHGTWFRVWSACSLSGRETEAASCMLGSADILWILHYILGPQSGLNICVCVPCSHPASDCKGHRGFLPEM